MEYSAFTEDSDRESYFMSGESEESDASSYLTRGSSGGGGSSGISHAPMAQQQGASSSISEHDGETVQLSKGKPRQRRSKCHTEQVHASLGGSANHSEAKKLGSMYKRYNSSVEAALLLFVADEIEDVVDALDCMETERRQRLAAHPLERLYLLQSPSYQREHERLVKEYENLLGMQHDLLSGRFRNVLHQKWLDSVKIASLYEKGGVFHRLYKRKKKSSSSRVSSEDSNKRNRVKKAKPSSSPSPPASAGGVSKLHQRLYDTGMALIRKKEERAAAAKEERKQREMEELSMYLQEAKLHAESYTSERKARERRGSTCTKSSVENTEAPGNSNRKHFSVDEEKEIFTRLSKKGYISKETLEERKKEKELHECTFKPVINNVSSSLIRPQKESVADVEKWLQRRRDRQEQILSARKSALLASRMKEDHHFCARVERDPRVAKRFLDTIVV